MTQKFITGDNNKVGTSSSCSCLLKSYKENSFNSEKIPPVLDSTASPSVKPTFEAGEFPYQIHLLS